MLGNIGYNGTERLEATGPADAIQRAAIYRKMGFREVPLDANDFSYERANIKMELELEASQEHGRKTLPGSAPQELTQNPAGWKIF